MRQYRFHTAAQVAREFPRRPGHRGFPRTRHIKAILRRARRAGLDAPGGYSPGTRLAGDRRRRARVRMEDRTRRELGLGRFDPWPQGDTLVFLVASEPVDTIDAVLCRTCLEEFPDDTVVGVEDVRMYDDGQEESCDHCGRQIGGADA